MADTAFKVVALEMTAPQFGMRAGAQRCGVPGGVITQSVRSVLRVVVCHKLIIRSDPGPGVLRGRT